MTDRGSAAFRCGRRLGRPQWLEGGAKCLRRCSICISGVSQAVTNMTKIERSAGTKFRAPLARWAANFV